MGVKFEQLEKGAVVTITISDIDAKNLLNAIGAHFSTPAPKPPAFDESQSEIDFEGACNE